MRDDRRLTFSRRPVAPEAPEAPDPPEPFIFVAERRLRVPNTPPSSTIMLPDQDAASQVTSGCAQLCSSECRAERPRVGLEPPRLNSLRNCRHCETNPSALRRFLRSFQGPLSRRHTATIGLRRIGGTCGGRRNTCTSSSSSTTATGDARKLDVSCEKSQTDAGAQLRLYMSLTHFPPARGRNWEAALLALAARLWRLASLGLWRTIWACGLRPSFGRTFARPQQRSFPPGLKLAGHAAGPRWGRARARDGWRARHALAARPRAATCAPKAARPLLDPIVLGLIFTRRRQNPRGSSRGDEPNAGWGAVAVGRIAFPFPFPFPNPPPESPSPSRIAIPFPFPLSAVGRRDRATSQISQISRRRPGGTSRHQRTRTRRRLSEGFTPELHTFSEGFDSCAAALAAHLRRGRGALRALRGCRGVRASGGRGEVSRGRCASYR
jgi:hypothetical protein